MGEKKRIIALRVPETNTSVSVVFISFTNKFSLNYVGRVGMQHSIVAPVAVAYTHVPLARAAMSLVSLVFHVPCPMSMLGHCLLWL